MDFKSALKTAAESHRSDKTKTPFLMYSQMSDLIGDSYDDKKKLSLFFNVTKRLFGSDKRIELSLKNIESLRARYSEVGDLLTESMFIGLIDLMIEAYGGKKSREIAAPKAKRENKEKAKREKKNADETKSEPEPKKSKIKPRNLVPKIEPDSAAKPEKSFKEKCSAFFQRLGYILKVCLKIILHGAICSALIFGLVYFSRFFSWRGYQWVVGIVSVFIAGVIDRILNLIVFEFRDDIEEDIEQYRLLTEQYSVKETEESKRIITEQYRHFAEQYRRSKIKERSKVAELYRIFLEQYKCSETEQDKRNAVALYRSYADVHRIDVNYAVERYRRCVEHEAAAPLKEKLIVLETIYYSVLAIANFVLWCLFRENYRVVCCWVSAPLILGGAGVLSQALDKNMYACLTIAAIVCVLAIATVIFAFVL